MDLKIKKTNLFLSILIIFFTLCSCIKPPLKEITNAQRALTSAQSSGADLYAGEDFEEMKSKLAQARKGMVEKNYEQSKILALEIILEADQVKSRVAKLKEEARKKAEKKLFIAHKALCDLEDKGKIRYNIDEYRAILQIFREVQKDYQKELYSIVEKKANEIIERCSILEKETQKMELKLKEEKAGLRKKNLKKSGPKVEKKHGLKTKEVKPTDISFVVETGDSLWMICQRGKYL